MVGGQQKNLGDQQFRSLGDQKKFWWKKNLVESLGGFKLILGSQIFYGQIFDSSNNFGVQIFVEFKKFGGPYFRKFKVFGVNIFDSSKILVDNFLGGVYFVVGQIFLGGQHFWRNHNFLGFKFCWVKSFWGSKFLMGQKF